MKNHSKEKRGVRSQSTGFFGKAKENAGFFASERSKSKIPTNQNTSNKKSGINFLDFSEEEVVEIKPQRVYVGKKEPEEIVEQELDKIKTYIVNVLNSFDGGLDNFDTNMTFASKQEAETQYMDVFIKTLFNIAFEELIKASGNIIGMIVKIIEPLIAERKRADNASGENKIADFIKNLRSEITDIQNKINVYFVENKNCIKTKFLELDRVKVNRTTGYIGGKKAIFILELQSIAKNLKSKSSEMDSHYFQQAITEGFALTGQYSAPISQGGRMSGGLYINTSVIGDSGKYSIKGVDSHWTLLSNSPKVMNVADSLNYSLNKRGLKPYQANLKKHIILNYENDVEWGFNDRADVTIHFDRNPMDYTLDGYSQRELPMLPYIRNAWGDDKIRGRILETTEIKGNTKL